MATLLPILFILVAFSCATEDAVVYDNSTITKSYRLLKGKDAQATKLMLLQRCKGEAMVAFKKSIKINTVARFTFEDLEPLIDQSEVFQTLDKDNNSTYTYRVAHPDATATTFYNIVMQEWGALTKIVLLLYDMDETFAGQYQSDGKFENFTGKISFEILSIDSGFPCENEPDFPVPVVGGSGTGTGGNGSGGGGSGGGGSGSGGGGANGGGSGGGGSGNVRSPGYYYSQAIVNAQYLALLISNPPTSSNGEGDGGDDEEMPDDEVHVSPRYFRVPPSLTDPSDPCRGGKDVGILPPTFSNPNKDNCNELKTQSADTDVKDALEDMVLKAEIPDCEYGYSISEDASGYTATEIPNTVPYLPISQDGYTVPFPAASQNAIGVIHTHPNDYQGYLMFSPQDILYFYKIYVKHSVPAGSNKNISSYSLIVTSHQGTYALKIDNLLKFNTAMQTKYGQKFIDDLEKRYQARLPMDPINHFEKDLLEFLGKFDLGLSLYKANSDFNNWSKITLNDNGNNIDGDDTVATPCP